MKPEDRIETKVSLAPIPKELKQEILAKLEWYRLALYKCRRENIMLNMRVSDYSWRDTPQQGQY